MMVGDCGGYSSIVVGEYGCRAAATLVWLCSWQV
jgi:hypothetical protein